MLPLARSEVPAGTPVLDADGNAPDDGGAVVGGVVGNVVGSVVGSEVGSIDVDAIDGGGVVVGVGVVVGGAVVAGNLWGGVEVAVPASNTTSA